MSSTLHELVLTTSPDGPITAYNASSGATVAHFKGSRSPRHGLTLVGKKFVAASHVASDTGAGSIHLYKWWSPAAFYNLPLPEPVAPLAATPDGAYLFAGGVSGNIHTLSIPSGDVVNSFQAHSPKAVSCLEICDDQQLLFSGGDDGSIAVIPIYELMGSSIKRSPNESILCRFVGHKSPVTDIIFGFGGVNCTIMSSSLDCTCKIWSLMYTKPIRTIRFPCEIWGIVMDSSESEFYAAGSDGLVYRGVLKVLNKQDLNEARKIVALNHKHCGPIVSIGIVNGGNNLVTASEDGNVWVWGFQGGEVVYVIGQEMKCISGLLVVKEVDDYGRFPGRMGGGMAAIGGGDGGFSSNELRRPTGKMMEMEERLNVVVKDRSRALNNLESAIGIYEKLLKLIVKQAKAGNKNDDTDDGDDDDKI